MMANRPRMVVTGSKGQVVSSLLGHSGNIFDIVSLGRPELDLLSLDTIESVICSARPDIIVSAAAYTAVDDAEAAEYQATVVNAVAAGKVAQAAHLMGVPVIHLSTDYVFDGQKALPYSESDPVSPINAYGRSKLAGELAVEAAAPNHVILRTSWVFGPYGRNFLKTMLSLAESREELSVVSEQVGCPTYSLDLADAIVAIGKNLLTDDCPKMRGVFHAAGQGSTSWARFAEEIFCQSSELSGPVARVNPIVGAQYLTSARRPENSQLDCSRLAKEHQIRLRPWQASVRDAVGVILGCS